MNANASLELAERRAPRPRAAKIGDFTTNRRLLLLTAMALVAGVGGAVSAWALVKLIALVTELVWFGRFSFATVSLAHVHASPWMIAAPALGGVAIGLMARFGSEKIRGHGIPEALEAILIGGSRMSPKVALLKPLSSALSIGTGGPFGAEGPIIMTGGAIGSLFAQLFNLSAAERKTLLVAGAAAGMTGIFGTPVAAVLLAVELLLFEWKPRSFVPTAAACATAIGLRPLLIGHGALFPFHGVPPLDIGLLLLAAASGLAAGLQSALLTWLLYRAEDLFERLPIHWMWWPALGGLVVGIGGLIQPRALGVGYDVIADLVDGRMTASVAGSLLAVKGGIWIIALASGTSGGVLAPLLILGGALGWLGGATLPGGHAFWAIVGMAAMVGGTMRAPLTAALFAVELTGEGGLLAPLLVAATTAQAVTVLLMKRSILTEKIARRGGHLTREMSIDPFEVSRVEEIMVRSVDTLPAGMAVDDAVAFFGGENRRHKSYPVVDAAGVLQGMVSRSDVLRWRRQGVRDTTLAEATAAQDLLTGNPDEVAATLADAMVATGQGRAPIVDHDGRLVGLVARKDLLKIRLKNLAEERDRRAFLREGWNVG